MTLRQRLMLMALGALVGLAAGALAPLPERFLPRPAEPTAPSCACTPPIDGDLRTA